MVELRGWTFAMTKPEIELRDATGTVVPVAVQFHGEWHGTGDLPGSRQQRSVARLVLPGPGAYTVHALDEVWPVQAT